MFREHFEFFRQFRTQFQTTGSIVPSSRHLARAMTRQIAAPRGPARILEVGPGTGAVTRRILKLLQKDDRLDLVELNESFAESSPRAVSKRSSLPAGRKSGSGACLRNRDISVGSALRLHCFGTSLCKFLRPVRGAALECHVRPPGAWRTIGLFRVHVHAVDTESCVGTNRAQSSDGFGSRLEWIFVADTA